MKRVFIFSLNYYPRFVGGAEVAIKEITDRFDTNEVEFHMVTLRHDSTLAKIEQVGNVLVHRIGFVRNSPDIADLKRWPLVANRYLYQIYACWHALMLNQKYHYDSIWAVMAHSAGIPAGLFKRVHPKAHYVLSLQEGDPLDQIQRMMIPVWPLFRNAFSAADTVQAISTFLGLWASRMGYKKKVHIIPNGVDHALFSKPTPCEERIQLRRELGISEQDTVLVTASRLVHKNGIDTVIEALPFLPETVRFVVYGIGPLQQQLKLLAEKCGVSSRVHFVGKIAHQDLPKRLSVGDIFIRPSRSEGMGNAFIEAFAKGLPVIGTREGGIADFLFSKTTDSEIAQTGWVVTADSPESIREAVQDIMAHPGVVKTVTDHAQSIAKTNYDWSTVVDKFKNLHIFDAR